jgi:hypothetical protein
MAARLAPSPTRTTHKRVLNFVSDGAWSDAAVLAAMRREVLPALEAHGAVRRWIVDETGMAKKGTHYTEAAVGQHPALSFSWGINQEKSEVVEVPEDRVFGRFGAHINSGRVVKTDRKATRQINKLDSQPTRRLLTGEEARKHKAKPPGKVYRWALDPKSGERVQVDIKLPGQNVPIDEDGSTRIPKATSPGSGTPVIPTLEEVMEQGYSEEAAQAIIDRETALANGETPTPNTTGEDDETTEPTKVEPEDDETPAQPTEQEVADANTPSEAEKPLTGDTTITTSTAGDPPKDEPTEDTRTKAELTEELKKKGLPVGGNRADLIARLNEA